GRLRAQIEEVAELNEALAPFRILTGIEVDILEDGALDQREDLLAGLDVVGASVHSKLRMEAREMTRRMVQAIASPNVDILGHCTGRKLVGRGRPPSQFDADLVFAACKQFDTALEINCRPERQDPPDDLLEQAIDWGLRFAVDTDAPPPGQDNCPPEPQDPPDDLLEQAIDWGLRFAVDTDAHAPGQMEWQTYGRAKAAPGAPRP